MVASFFRSTSAAHLVTSDVSLLIMTSSKPGTQGGKISCVCGVEDDINRPYIQCEECQVWQHNECMNQSLWQEELPVKYYCEACRPDNHERLLDAIEQWITDRIATTTSLRTDITAIVRSDIVKHFWILYRARSSPGKSEKTDEEIRALIDGADPPNTYVASVEQGLENILNTISIGSLRHLSEELAELKDQVSIQQRLRKEVEEMYEEDIGNMGMNLGVLEEIFDWVRKGTYWSAS